MQKAGPDAETRRARTGGVGRGHKLAARVHYWACPARSVEGMRWQERRARACLRRPQNGERAGKLSACSARHGVAEAVGQANEAIAMARGSARAERKTHPALPRALQFALLRRGTPQEAP